MKSKFTTILGFVITTIIIAVMLPQNKSFDFQYHIGEVWSDDDVVALFDFPILKSEAEYNADVQYVVGKHVPIFSHSNSVADKVMRRIAYDLKLDTYLLAGISSTRTAAQQAYKKIEKSYDNGVIDKKSNQSELKNDIVRVVEGDSIIDVALSSFSSPSDILEVMAPYVDIENYVSNYITPNIIYNKELNQYEIQKATATVSRYKDFVTLGKPIVKRGEMVDGDVAEVLESYIAEYNHKKGVSVSHLPFVGNLLYTAIIMTLLCLFYFGFRERHHHRTGNIMFLFVLYIFMTLLCFVVSKIDSLSLYIVPMAIVPFYIVTFYGIRMSLYEYASVLAICSMFSTSPGSFFVINFFSGLAGVFTLQNSYLRLRFFTSLGVVLLVNCLGYLAISLIEEPNVSLIDWGNFIWFPMNALILLALYQLIYIFEKMFNFVTDITLMELCDNNHALLRELAEKAPGTFQHSVQVANLAEAAAKEIGANPHLARAGALYHDIGKMENPLFFIENCSGGYNPHDSLAPLESVNVIKQHLVDGVRLAKKHNLPETVVSFIPTHHARAVIYFFYRRYKEQNPDVEIDMPTFCYDGPLPVRKEATICMMADSIEAASRTLKEYSYKSISDLIDKIVESQMNDGNFADSLLTFSDIERVKKVFKNKIMGMYHSRVSYPEREKNEKTRV